MAIPESVKKETFPKTLSFHENDNQMEQISGGSCQPQHAHILYIYLQMDKPSAKHHVVSLGATIRWALQETPDVENGFESDRRGVDTLAWPSSAELVAIRAQTGKIPTNARYQERVQAVDAKAGRFSLRPPSRQGRQCAYRAPATGQVKPGLRSQTR